MRPRDGEFYFIYSPPFPTFFPIARVHACILSVASHGCCRAASPCPSPRPLSPSSPCQSRIPPQPRRWCCGVGMCKAHRRCHIPLPTHEQSITQTRHRRSLYAHVPRHEAVVFHAQGVVSVIGRRTVERVAHHLSPMLHAHVVAVVVIVVAATDVVGYRRRAVVIHGAA